MLGTPTRSSALLVGPLLTLVGCFDFTATPFGEKGLRCDVGGRCDPGLVCDAADYCVDPCEGVRCSGHGVCRQAEGATLCDCDSGFVVSGLNCLEVGSLGAACGPSATCAVGLTCVANVCVDACSLVDCGGHGTCALFGSVAQCDCDDGYHSDSASCVDNCQGVTCGGHGECSMVGTIATCVCEAGYTPSGLACVSDACVPSGVTTLVCEGGHILTVDSCDRRTGQQENCGYRGCTGTSCLPVTWIGYGPSEVGPWSVSQGFSASPAGVSGTGNVLSSSIVLDAAGRPIVTWTFGGTNRVRLLRWSGSTWTGASSAAGSDIVLTEQGYADNVGLVLSSNNLPIVVWESLRVDGFEIYLRAWSGADWSDLGTSSTGPGLSNSSDDAHGPSIALLPNGRPFVAWADNGTGTYRVHVAHWTGTAWAGFLGGNYDEFAQSIYSSLSAVVDSSGRPVVAFVSVNEPMAYRFELGAWTRLGTTFTTGASSLKMVAEQDSKLLITWREEVSSQSEVFARVWDGTGWTALGGSGSGGGVSNTLTASNEPTIASANDGKPFIAWTEGTGTGRQVYLRQWNGTSWAEFPAGSATGGGVSNMTRGNDLPSIAASPERVCVSWHGHGTNGGDLDVFLRCATR